MNLSWVWGMDRKIDVMPNSDPEGQIFLSTPKNRDRFFFSHTFWFPVFDFSIAVAILNESRWRQRNWKLTICDVLMMSTPNVLTTELCDLLYNQCIDNSCCYSFLAHLSRRLTRWAYRIGLELASLRPCVCASVRPSTLSNMTISETSRPITTKFYLKHHWGGGKAALGFGADQIRTLVSMATDSSHRVIMGKRASSRFLDCDRILFILAGNYDIHKSLHEFEIWLDPTTDNRVSCPWASEKIPIDLQWGKLRHHIFLAVFDRILFILAGNEDIHKSLDEFEFRPDPTTDYGVSCPWASKKSTSPLFLRCYWSGPFQTCR